MMALRDFRKNDHRSDIDVSEGTRPNDCTIRMETALSSQSVFSGSEYNAPYNTPRDRSREREYWMGSIHRQFPLRKPIGEKFSRHRSREKRRHEKGPVLDTFMFENTIAVDSSQKPSNKRKFKKGVKVPVQTSQLPPVPEMCELSNKLLEKDVTLDIICEHRPQIGSHSRSEHLRKTMKWRRGSSNEEAANSCIICNIQKTRTKQIDAADTAKILESSFFSQDFYDQFTRESKKSQEENKQKVFKICKKADIEKRVKIVDKFCDEQGKDTVVSTPVVSSTPALSYCSKTETPDSEYSTGKSERLIKIYLPQGKEIHTKCRPKSHLVHFSDDQSSREMEAIYRKKALKGGFMKKEQSDKTEGKYFINSGIYSVGSLGLIFNIPDYNPNLGNRHVSIPTAFVSRSSKCLPQSKSKGTLLPPVKKTRFLPAIEIIN